METNMYIYVQSIVSILFSNFTLTWFWGWWCWTASDCFWSNITAYSGNTNIKTFTLSLFYLSDSQTQIICRKASRLLWLSNLEEKKYNWYIKKLKKKGSNVRNTEVKVPDMVTTPVDYLYRCNGQLGDWWFLLKDF